MLKTHARTNPGPAKKLQGCGGAQVTKGVELGRRRPRNGEFEDVTKKDQREGALRVPRVIDCSFCDIVPSRPRLRVARKSINLRVPSFHGTRARSSIGRATDS